MTADNKKDNFDDANIAESLAAIASQYPDRTGLVYRDGDEYYRWSFAEINDLTGRFALYLSQQGFVEGERVILMVKPSIEFICLTFALFRIGAVVVLIDPGMGYRNLLSCIREVKPSGFVGIGKAHLFRTVFRSHFSSIKRKVCVGFCCGIFGKSITARSIKLLVDKVPDSSHFGKRKPEDQAAILFTTGSTGPPKGVCYSHANFQAQLALIRDYYKIKPGDVDQPAFPLFGLFSITLGACVVIPEMDASRPAQVDPAKFIRTIQENKVTYSFGSPTIWRVVSSYCYKQKIRLNSLEKVLMAGAPVPGDLVEKVLAIMGPDGEVHTPYGATESLPIVSMTGSEIVNHTWPLTRLGKGVCVGRPLPGITVDIIPVSDGPIRSFDKISSLETEQVGEIIVRGNVVTSGYYNNDRENELSKIYEADRFWHRMGDLGYFDEKGRLWFCGRKAHRIETRQGTMYSVCCEALFNEHPKVFRSALVGIGEPGKQVPVIIVELKGKEKDTAQLLNDLHVIASQNNMTRNIITFLIHPGFPVDIRHNAKIFREKLAVWAAEQVEAGRM
jgi:acyl-CoA synthetase (AMP-forming)/AMP-acid ligase II